MRNCYVYKCDWKHKNNPKRAMFTLPKDPEKFKQWTDVLPKHRLVTTHDRVCEKHFAPEDILRDWSHQIQGTTKTVQRCKPNLRPNAIPRYFDVTQAELQAIISKRKRKATQGRLEELQDQGKKTPVGKPTIEDEPATAGSESAESEKRAIFEDVYENIFEVELPSTLWGVHRDPDRSYIAFTRFQMVGTPDSMTTTTTTLVVENSLKCCVWSDKAVVFEEDLYEKMVSQKNDDEPPSRSTVITHVLDVLEQFVSQQGEDDVLRSVWHEKVL